MHLCLVKGHACEIFTRQSPHVWYVVLPAHVLYYRLSTTSLLCVQVESLVQSKEVRAKLRVLAHLPLQGAFKLAEVALDSLLPTKVLQPFVAELATRARRRERRMQVVACTYLTV